MSSKKKAVLLFLGKAILEDIVLGIILVIAMKLGIL